MDAHLSVLRDRITQLRGSLAHQSDNDLIQFAEAVLAMAEEQQQQLERIEDAIALLNGH